MSVDSSSNWPAPPIRYRLNVTKVTSMVLLSQRRSVSLTGSLAEIEAAYKRVQAHNWLAGWWGIPFGVIWTPVVLGRNSSALKKVRALAASGASAPGWFPDPSTRHTTRYWNGAAWTDQVQGVGTDTPAP